MRLPNGSFSPNVRLPLPPASPSTTLRYHQPRGFVALCGLARGRIRLVLVSLSFLAVAKTPTASAIPR